MSSNVVEKLKRELIDAANLDSPNIKSYLTNEINKAFESDKEAFLKVIKELQSEGKI